MMIICSLFDAHKYGGVLQEQFSLRFRVFKERCGWDVTSYRGMEYDEFDTPAAKYLLYLDETETVKGMMRLAPTSIPYMIEKVWPDWLPDLPRSERIWEGTRLAVDHDVSSSQRCRILRQLLCAAEEYCLSEGVERILHVTPVPLLKQIFIRNGFDTRELTMRRQIDNLSTVIAETRLSAGNLAFVRQKLGQPVPFFSQLENQAA